MVKVKQSSRPDRLAKSRIPVFKTIEEAAEFWDTHSLADFVDELEDVTGQIQFIRGGPTKIVRVRLDLKSYAILEAQAKEFGVRASRLARVWLFDRAWEEEHPAAREKRKARARKPARSKAG